ncbi:SMI1/KNR4 family protein [Jeotgalibacillus sp. ET6]|uniref:SMI1/KNR4 family protein n=1 Tax=Jeotgalibacillus sp. ET6 TaxID=3037260 RepID=UPI002418B4E8|nr:SMI1/KNR4 family protein [Jeotgalibacillus sp. ET6]MDG5471397.1 SMI1/KNR4 family protein [Jeotgalibacillus sp. ET6]
MEQKLGFLRKYNRNAQLISCHEIHQLECGKIPNSWYELFQEENAARRVEMILSFWKERVGVELRNTISYLSRHLEEVELMDINGRYSILYTIKTDDGEIRYYEGGNPKDEFNNKELEKSWGKFPSTIRNFYQTVHNGFYYYSSQSMGLVPLEDVTFFDDDEWGIIEELEEPLQIDLQTTFGFFKSGMGGYVAVDYKNFNNDNATLWWTNKEPRYNLDFWDIVDEWIVIGFEV